MNDAMSTPSPADAFFQGVARASRVCELGAAGSPTFSFPTFFYRSECLQMAFPVALSRLRRMVAARGVDDAPVVFLPGYGVLALTVYAHRAIAEMPPYNEVVWSIPVRGRGTVLPPLLPLVMEPAFPQVRQLVLDMPVDSDVNRLRGHVLWSLPKTAGEIQWQGAQTGEHELRIRTEAFDFRLSARTRARTPQLMQRRNTVLGTLSGARREALSVSEGRFERHRFFLSRPALWQAQLNVRDTAHPLHEVRGALRPPIELRCSQDLRMALHLPHHEETTHA